jgi:hypothetical protein
MPLVLIGSNDPAKSSALDRERVGGKLIPIPFTGA